MRFVVVLVLALLMVGLNKAWATTLELVGAGPTGTVVMSDPPSGQSVPSPSPLGSYNGDNFYAGVLDWTDQPTSSSTLPAADYYTYCVDISSVINFGSTYPVTPESVGTIFTPAITNAIDNLWQDQPAAADLALGSSATAPPSLGGNADIDAEQFQIALWDIIYDAGSDSNTYSSTTPLVFGTPSIGSLTTALGWANQAYYLDTRNNSLYDGVSILQAGDQTSGGSGLGQNQAIMYISGGPLGSTAPLPSPFVSGLVLLGLVAIAKAWPRGTKPAIA